MCRQHRKWFQEAGLRHFDFYRDRLWVQLRTAAYTTTAFWNWCDLNWNVFFSQVVFMYNNVVCDFKILMEPRSHRENQCTQRDRVYARWKSIYYFIYVTLTQRSILVFFTYFNFTKTCCTSMWRDNRKVCPPPGPRGDWGEEVTKGHSHFSTAFHHHPPLHKPLLGFNQIFRLRPPHACHSIDRPGWAMHCNGWSAKFVSLLGLFNELWA